MRRLRIRDQFQALLAERPVSRTAHFALHRLRLRDQVEGGTRAPLFEPAGAPWLGAMVPKRWARRAVTRNAIRRQIYAVGEGLWSPLGADARLVRLRAAFSPQHYPSASSAALKSAVRAELQQLFAQERRG